MAGMLVLVVGPSGAGKDTLIARAKATLAGDPRYGFPRRLVTRVADASLENHDTISWEEFRAGVAANAFPLHWEAHGLGYAVPLSIEDDLAADRTVVLNVSRRIIMRAVGTYSNVHVVFVHTDRAVRASRLVRRGREAEADVAARLAREGRELLLGVPTTIVDNSGALEPAVEAFLTAIRGFSSPA
jgi:phosphonate metabolism protein PhnN/1,5-bisphosphokinase (PRPP-forming)